MMFGGVSGAFRGGINVTLFVGSIAFAGGFIGFLLPRQILTALVYRRRLEED